MVSITRRFEFSMGHALHQHAYACKRLHGHNYLALITVASDTLDAQGMVLDFGILKAVANRIIDQELDHRFMVYEKDPRAGPLQEIDHTIRIVTFNPTAENIALYLKERLNAELQHHRVTVTRVQLWETNNCHAEV
jgi:6-pyruvoyltetrahydropterin/6-carboxytetrahydropterin synthase